MLHMLHTAKKCTKCNNCTVTGCRVFCNRCLILFQLKWQHGATAPEDKQARKHLHSLMFSHNQAQL